MFNKWIQSKATNKCVEWISVSCDSSNDESQKQWLVLDTAVWHSGA